jgi:hypothetical protein
VIAAQRTRHAAIAYSWGSRLLFLCDRINPVVRVWDLTTGNERAALRGPTGTVIMNLAPSPDGMTLAVANYRGEVFFGVEVGKREPDRTYGCSPPSWG